jgi:division protein CdvB (Snf7/Vps24/ESCRT-III family)
MSGYAPDINYHLMTHPKVTEKEIQALHKEILEIQQYVNIGKKRLALRTLRQKLDQILLRMSGAKELAAHMHEHIDL